MGLNIISGPAKSGKTQYIMYLIEKESLPLIQIVPEQISLSYENKIIEKCGYLSADRDVLSFGRLFYRVYKELSYKKREYISSSGKAIILTKIMEQNLKNLKVFNNEKRLSSYSQSVLETISEFKRYGVMPQNTKEFSESTQDAYTKAKFSDLTLLYSEFDKELSKFGCNSEDNLNLLLSLIPESNYIKERVFYIDGFSSFTTVELNIIELLIKYSKAVYITVKTDLKNMYLFEETENTRRSLLNLCPSANEITLTDNNYHIGELLHLCENYGKFSPKKYMGELTDINVFVAESIGSEIDLVARNIVNDIKHGYSFSDIYVVASDPSEYLNLLESSFKLHNINLYTDKKHNVLNHALSLVFISLFDIFINGFDFESVFSFLKSGFLDIPSENISLFENYVLKHGIKGKAYFEDFKFDTLSPDYDTINQTRKALLDIVMPFREKTKGKNSCSVFCDALKDFISRINLYEKTSLLVNELTLNNKKDIAKETSLVFNSIIKTIKETHALLADYSVGIERFKELFVAGLGEHSISIVPPDADAVTFSSLDAVRNHDVKILYILNANEGHFPKTTLKTGVITDTERLNLKEFGLTLAPDNKRNAMAQPFKIYEILTAPQVKLTLSRSLADSDGKPTIPSPVLKSLKDIFPRLSQKGFMDKTEALLVSTPHATIRQILLNKDVDFKNAVSWYNKSPGWKEKFNRLTQNKSFILKAQLNEEASRLLWKKELNVTVSRLESFSRCPFKFLMDYGLKLKEREDSKVKINDAGTFVHKIMEEAVKKITDDGNTYDTLTKENCILIAENVYKYAVDELVKVHPNISKKDLLLLQRMKKAASDAVLAVAHHINAGDFIPYRTELEIGKDEILPLEIITPKGNKVKLYGKIDRVDKENEGFRIIDYKSSDKELKLGRIYEGISLQLITYATALKDTLGKPKGMYYFIFSPKLIEQSVAYSPDLVQKEMVNAYRLSGFTVGGTDSIINADNAMDKRSTVIKASVNKDGEIKSSYLITDKEFEQLSEKAIENMGKFSDKIIAGEFDISPLSDERKACEFCPYSSVCRFEDEHFKTRYAHIKKDSEILEIINDGEVK